jgi:predicted transcriptional regulator
MASASITSLELDPETKARIDRIALSQQRAPDLVIREAIADYVSREEKRLSFLQDAQSAWEDYQRTGLHLTDEEVGDWIVKLEAGEDADLPECHV